MDVLSSTINDNVLLRNKYTTFVNAKFITFVYQLFQISFLKAYISDIQ